MRQVLLYPHLHIKFTVVRGLAKILTCKWQSWNVNLGSLACQHLGS